jgi:hypothetical protein
MKSFTVALLASMVSTICAAPSPIAVQDKALYKRQSMNEWSAKKPNCKSAIFFFARGSTEMGNVVSKEIVFCIVANADFKIS